MKKTVEEWFKEFPDGYRELALKNLNSKRKDLLAKSQYEALGVGFLWKESPEKEDFWPHVSYYILDPSKPLPPLPGTKPEEEPKPREETNWKKKADSYRKGRDYWKDRASELLALQTDLETYKERNKVLSSINDEWQEVNERQGKLIPKCIGIVEAYSGDVILHRIISILCILYAVFVLVLKS